MSKRVKIEEGEYSHSVIATATLVFHIEDNDLKEFRQTHPGATAKDYVKHCLTWSEADYGQIDTLDKSYKEELKAPVFAIQAG